MHAEELNRMSARLRQNAAQLQINGVERFIGAPVMAADLRAGAALTLAGLSAEGETELRRIYHVDRGYERFEQKLASVGAKIRRVREEEHQPEPDLAWEQMMDTEESLVQERPSAAEVETQA
jgi:UDP-N-acetylglucosamine 1-carboxyvinyltransferase